jgi:hypothetical protein
LIDEIAFFRKGIPLSTVDNAIIKVEHWKPSAGAKLEKSQPTIEANMLSFYWFFDRCNSGGG